LTLNTGASGGIVEPMQILRSPSEPPRTRVILQRRIGDVRLVLQGNGHPSDAEMHEHIEEAIGMAGFVRAVLVIAEGPHASGPDARHRAKMGRAGLLRVPTAVVTDSALARGIMTAVGWVGAPIQGFAPAHISRAYDYLKLSSSVRARIPDRLDAMRVELYGSSQAQPGSTTALNRLEPTLR
jgi:hypothetical protein